MPNKAKVYLTDSFNKRESLVVKNSGAGNKNEFLEELSKVSDDSSSAAGMDSIKNMAEVETGSRHLLEYSDLFCFSPDSATKEETMELQRDSSKYKDFLQLVEDLAETGDWVTCKVYSLFCKGSNELREMRLKLAICNRNINFQIKTEEGKILNDGSKKIDDHWGCLVNSCLSGTTGTPEFLLLEADSFLAWLKSKYPYEGEEQAKAEPKENQSYMSHELQLAVACSRELYPTKPPEASTPGEKKTNAQTENKRINEWLQRNGVNVQRRRDRIRVMVNPYSG